MAPPKGKEKKKEWIMSLGPQDAEGENVFGVCHIFASFSDTLGCVMDLSGKEAICLKSSPCAAVLAAQDIVQRCKKLGLLRRKTPDPGTLAHSWLAGLKPKWGRKLLDSGTDCVRRCQFFLCCMNLSKD
uniref:Uncharacterized protein n=1 Tax=Salvator merianae TaxID=96440 RepID=A0A8D0BLV3_SALMN